MQGSSIFSKIFLITCICGLMTYTFLAVYMFQMAYFKSLEYDTMIIENLENPKIEIVKQTMKYILIWTYQKGKDNLNMLKGQNSFIKQNCKFTNCFISRNKNLLKNDYTHFDAILFHGENFKWNSEKLPKRRSWQQKYVFVSKEPADENPICNGKTNNYFNWTWTYKLDSDIISPFIKVKNKIGTIIGPKLNMKWITDTPISHELRDKLKRKSKDVILIEENCRNIRHNFFYNFTVLNELKTALELFNLNLDIYGPCSSNKCPNNNFTNCLNLVEREYRFYLVFERSFTKDYVTKNLLNALNHYSVPILLGNYSYSK